MVDTVRIIDAPQLQAIQAGHTDQIAANASNDDERLADPYFDCIHTPKQIAPQKFRADMRDLYKDVQKFKPEDGGQLTPEHFANVQQRLDCSQANDRPYSVQCQRYPDAPVQSAC